ncbi:MAG: DMT family transporter [Pseudomonadota bacterium]
MSPAVQVTTVVLLALFWALNWPMMKIGLTVLEPWTFRATLVFIGGAGCLLMARAFGQSIAISRADLKPLLWLTLFQGVLWNAASGFGIAWVDAGRASVLAFTMPIWATLLSILFLGERVTLRRTLGLALGMGAMVLLLWPALAAVGQELAGGLLMLSGAICWAIATIIVKAVRWDMGVLALSGWQFFLASGPLLAAAFLLGEPATLLDLDWGTGAVFAYSALIPMIFCQAVWFTVVQRLPTSLASTGTLLVPPLGVLLSALILGEAVGVLEVLALVLAVSALLMILPGFNWRATLHPPQASRPE